MISRYWFAHDPARTQFFNALSIVFPELESFVIKSAAHYANKVEDKTDLMTLIHDEVHHTQVHNQYNQYLRDQGYDVDKYQKGAKRVSKILHHLSPKIQLALSTATEHFTHIASKEILEKNIVQTADPKVRAVWIWHCREEVNHRHIAFNIYNEIGGGYIRRIMVLIFSSFLYYIILLFIQASLLRKDRKLRKFFWPSTLFLWGKNGFFRSLWPEWKLFFKKDFHPNNLKPAVDTHVEMDKDSLLVLLRS